jgi:hypothetical protein
MATDPKKIAETARSLHTKQPADLQSEVWHLMHRHSRTMQAAREEAGRQAAEDQDRLRALIVDLAGAHHQLRRFLEQHTGAGDGAQPLARADVLATIRDRYEQVLTRAGAKLIYLDDQPFTVELSGQVKITASIPAEGVDRPRVRETVSPGVLLNGEMVCPVQIELAVPARPTTTTSQANGDD